MTIFLILKNVNFNAHIAINLISIDENLSKNDILFYTVLLAILV